MQCFRVTIGSSVNTFKEPHLGAGQGTSVILKHMGTCAWCTAGTWPHLHLVPGDQRCGRGGGGGGGRGSRRAGGTEVHCLISTSCQDFREQPRMLQNCLELFKFHLTLLHLTLETSEWFKLHLLSTALHVWRGLAGVGGGDHQQGGRPCHNIYFL